MESLEVKGSKSSVIESNDKKKKLKLSPKIILFIGVLGVSLASIFVKYSDAPSVVIATYRLGWTVLLMSPYVWLKSRKELLSLDFPTISKCCLSGVFLALHFSFWFESLKFTSVASSTVLVCLEAIFCAIGYIVFLKGKIHRIGILAILITFSGSVLIAINDMGGGVNIVYGDILAVLGAIFVAIYTLIGTVQRAKLSTTVYTYITYSSCLVCLLLFDLVSGTPLIGYGWKELFIGLLMGVSCTIFGHSVFSWCLKYLSPSYVASAKLLSPVISSLAAIIIYSEFPTIVQCVGGIIVLAGVLLYSNYER